MGAVRREPALHGTGQDTWDHEIRERGFLLREGGLWKLWYTGYDSRKSETKSLGYATSSDGLRFTRHPRNPIFDGVWTEDVFVVHHGGGYFMFAEGAEGHRAPADLLRRPVAGRSRVRSRSARASGEPLSPGPYGTPTVWIEGDTWYLFYERDDKGVWLATSQGPARVDERAGRAGDRAGAGGVRPPRDRARPGGALQGPLLRRLPRQRRRRSGRARGRRASRRPTTS